MSSLKYTDGFNAGYRFQKESPEIYERTAKNLTGDSPYVQGFKDGKLQVDMEQQKALDKSPSKETRPYTRKDYRKDFMKPKDSSKDKNKDMDRD